MQEYFGESSIFICATSSDSIQIWPFEPQGWESQGFFSVSVDGGFASVVVYISSCILFVVISSYHAHDEVWEMVLSETRKKQPLYFNCYYWLSTTYVLYKDGTRDKIFYTVDATQA